MTDFLISFTVLGDAAPAGSKRAFVNPKTGRAHVTDASSRSKPWQAEVRAAAREAYQGELLTGPLAVEFSFFRPRPAAHFGSGRNSHVLKPSAPEFPITRPDLLKTARGIEDALSGVLYRDDAQIVREHLYKLYGAPARCVVSVMPAAAQPVAVAA